MKTGFDAVNDAIERAKPDRYPPTKVYVLFPRYGSFSVQTIDYHGTELSVAATSVRQAYALAHKGIWIDPEHTHPTGIVAIYRRASGFTLWCGCSGHDVTGGQPPHGAGIRALRAEIDGHHCDGQNLAVAVKD